MSDPKRLIFQPDQMAKTLGLKPDQVKAIFRDGRSAAAFAEHWAARAYGFPPRRRQQDKGVNLVRVMTSRGVDFTPSGGKGKGRSATYADIVSNIEGFERIFVVDVADFPVVLIHESDKKRLVQLVYASRLGVGGLRRKEYYELCVDQGRLFDANEFNKEYDPPTTNAMKAGV